MAVDRNYTLYLGYNVDADNYYPIGLLYGKVPVDSEEVNFYGNFENEHIMKVVKELRRIQNKSFEILLSSQNLCFASLGLFFS